MNKDAFKTVNWDKMISAQHTNSSKTVSRDSQIRYQDTFKTEFVEEMDEESKGSSIN